MPHDGMHLIYGFVYVGRFPLRKKAVLEKWIRNVRQRQEGFVPTATSYHCGQHFLPEMFTDGSKWSKRPCLRKDALPTGMRIFRVNIDPLFAN